MSSVEIYVNPDNREVFATEGLQAITSPGIMHSSAAVQRRYSEDRDGYFQRLGQSVRTIRANPESSHPAPVTYSVFHDSRIPPSDELTLIFSPLNDCAPASFASEMSGYIHNPNPTKADREKAQPNSWRQAMKAADIYETQVAEGVSRPVAVIYSPPDERVFSENDLLELAAGNTSPFGKVASEVIDSVQRELYGTDAQPQIKRLHIYAPGMGHNAIGAAHFLQFQGFGDYEVASLTTPNLIAGIRNKAQLLARYSIMQNYREPGIVDLAGGALPESLASRETDRLGSEKAMRKRQFGAMLGFEYLSAMMHSRWIAKAVGDLLETGTAITVPTAYNAKITEKTDEYLPVWHPGLERISIKSGVTGKNANLMTNEFVTLGSVLALRGAMRADQTG